MAPLRTILLALALPLAACRAGAEPEDQLNVATLRDGPVVVMADLLPPEAELSVAERPDGPVVDMADLLPPDDEAELDARLRRLWDETGTALVVSTVDTLGGELIEEFTRNQFREWGIGSSETQRGVLILVAPNERQARLEVGCGIETVITNQVALRIMGEEMISRFRDGDYVGGINGGVDAVIEELETSTAVPGPTTAYCVELMQEAA